MSMSAAIGNFMSWSERHRARREHERLGESEDTPPTSPSSVDPVAPSTSDSSATTRRQDNSNTVPAVEPVPDDEEMGGAAAAAAAATAAATPTSTSHDGETAGEESDDDDDASVVPPSDGGIMRRRRTLTLAELEEEREMARRRTSACILLAVFILFRLWVEALAMRDIGLLMLCLVGTSWTARFIRSNREREEELDRRIAAYLENGEDGGGELDRDEFRMLSFQAQLALAIMESQRNMMQGGFGHPDGQHAEDEGVSDEAKEHWQQFQYKPSNPTGASRKGDYGSVGQEDGKVMSGLDDVPHCSICLSEYEDGENLVRLPCSHEFHDNCISSWTSNHVRCPLCNLDLESVSSDAVATTASTVPPEDSIV